MLQVCAFADKNLRSLAHNHGCRDLSYSPRCAARPTWGATFFARSPQERESPRFTLFARDGLVCREKRILLVAFSLRPWSKRRFFGESEQSRSALAENAHPSCTILRECYVYSIVVVNCGFVSVSGQCNVRGGAVPAWLTWSCALRVHVNCIKGGTCGHE
jgi:hypothetical protein